MLKNILSLSIIFAFCSSVAAGSVSGARVTLIRTDTNGSGIIYFDQPLTSPAACVSGFPNSLAFSPTTSRTVVAAMMLAQATGRLVIAYGLNQCSTYGVVEDLYYTAE